jgi:hypothetical protein
MWAGTHFLVAQKHVVPWIIRFVWLKIIGPSLPKWTWWTLQSDTTATC